MVPPSELADGCGTLAPASDVLAPASCAGVDGVGGSESFAEGD